MPTPDPLPNLRPEPNGRPSTMLERLDPRPIGWPKVAVLALLVAGAIGMRALGAVAEAGTFLGLCGLALGINGIRRSR